MGRVRSIEYQSYSGLSHTGKTLLLIIMVRRIIVLQYVLQKSYGPKQGFHGPEPFCRFFVEFSTRNHV